ncbi:unnamed protein product [Schistosoma curassoni]|uniref:Ovule protein n=1 Tax=Schistosoma curassoni TaxID=6186 RepID=A0A183L778_9TREM|nr:unnamed protein product [Schistosoma curassoni]
MSENPKLSELTTVHGQTVSKQVDKSLVDPSRLINPSSSSADQPSSLVPNTIKLPSVSNDRIISIRENQLSPESVDEKRMNTSDHKDGLVTSYGVSDYAVHITCKLPFTFFLNVYEGDGHALSDRALL